MKQYFKCIAKVESEDKNGNLKYIKEVYIVKAINPTDVEAKMAEDLKGIDFEIVSIVLTNIVSIID